MSQTPLKILLVEDSESLRNVIQNLLEHSGYQVFSFENAEAALLEFGAQKFDCVVADFKLPGMHGIEFLAQIRNLNKNIPFLIMTAYGSVSIAVKAMQEGANDFLEKPFEPEMFLSTISDLIKYRRIIDRKDNNHLHKERKILTRNTQMLEILKIAGKTAKVTSSVLVTGESGTGKELIARYIHEQSTRSEQPFVAINCAAIPKDLIESELFGHEAGAFTGATQQRIGLLEFATKGTVFLDELGDMPLAMQVKLLRTLQEKEIRRVGGNKNISVQPRIVAATNKDPAQLIEQGLLREDLYYRISVVSLELPPLRARPEDIELLANEFVQYFSHMSGKAVVKLSKTAQTFLNKYSWPGNIRELENVIERAVLMANSNIKPEHLGISLQSAIDNTTTTTQTLLEISQIAAKQAEIEAIVKILSQTRGNKSKAAEMLGVSYKTLLHKVKEYQL